MDERLLTYKSLRKEKRSKKVNILIRPSVNEKLNQMVQENKISSKNDFINFLLDSYFDEMEDKEDKENN